MYPNLRRAILLGVGVLATCDASAPPPKLVGTTVAALDTDSDGLIDADEISYFGDLSQAAFDDYDSDKYPNIFEFAKSTDPTDDGDTPAADVTVDLAHGEDSAYDDIYSTFSAAFFAAPSPNAIIAVAPGVYSAEADSNGLYVPAGALVIGTGPDAIVDGMGLRPGWYVPDPAYISSLTFRRLRTALQVYSDADPVVLEGVVIHSGNCLESGPGALLVSSGEVSLFECAFVGNTSLWGSGQQIMATDGTLTFRNPLVWSASGAAQIDIAGTATASYSYTLIKGETLSGTGNISGSTDPLVRHDGHLGHASPLISAGAASHGFTDIDGESRPDGAPDIGADEHVDSDSDDLADWWEQKYTASLGTLTSLGQDGDGDGATNEEEYMFGADPTDSDSDDDGLVDGDELDLGTDPPKRTPTPTRYRMGSSPRAASIRCRRWIA